jgi:ATP-dependent Clp protease adaptor protein ClpS
VPERVDPDTGIVTETRTSQKTKKPPLYKVLFHNDNYTTMEFVVAVLEQVFHRTHSEAERIMLEVHHKGAGLAGVYTFEVAETKIKTTEELAREHEYPLKLSMEPEE